MSEIIDATYEHEIDLEDRTGNLEATLIRATIAASNRSPEDYSHTGITARRCVEQYFEDLITVDQSMPTLSKAELVLLYNEILKLLPQYIETYFLRMKSAGRDLDDEKNFFLTLKPYAKVDEFLSTQNINETERVNLKRYAMGMLDLLGFRHYTMY